MDAVQKLLVIGLDGATWSLMAPWLDAGELPTLAQLVAAGSSGRLRSTLPPLTAPAWSSFITGKEPANHGVFDFFRPDPRPQTGPLELINSTHIRSHFFWHYLSAAGISAGVLNVPTTYPPRPLQGYLASGLLTPGNEAVTYPPDLLQTYRPELGPYYVTPQLRYAPGNEVAFSAALRTLTATQIRYALRLAQDKPASLLIVHFLAPDIAQHKLWHHLDATHPRHDPTRAQQGATIRQLYTQIDAGLAALLDVVPEATVLILSDHGFGPQTRTVNLNLYFATCGLLALKSGRRLRRRAWRHTWTTKVGQRLWRREHLLSWDDVDWSRTRAYSLGHMGQVWLNVPPSKREATRAEVTAALQALRDTATGGHLVDRLIWREEIATGPYAHFGPDLHLIMDDYRALAYPQFAADGRIITTQRLGDSGNHRPDGILIAAGPGIRAGAPLRGARLIDLAPTILHLLGVAVPDDMDGNVLQPLLTTTRAVTYQTAEPLDAAPTTLTDHQQAGLTTRLQALGYLQE